MIVGSSEVEGKQIPVVTMLIIIVCVIVFAKSYLMECHANRQYQKSYMVYAYGQENGPHDKIDELAEFYDEFGFQMQDLGNQDFHSLFTHMFVHGGLLHILGNMLALWAFAVALEDLFGVGMFTGLYFICGLAACFAQGLCDMGSTVPMIGASGAIAGVMGAYLVMFGGRTSVKFLYYFFGFRIANIPVAIFCTLWFLAQVGGILADGTTSGGVALVAHLAGFGVGAVIAFVIKGEFKDRITSGENGAVKIASKSENVVTEQQILDEVLACQPFEQVVETLGDCEIDCPKCGDKLDMEHPVSERLVRCVNSECSHMTYVDGELLASSM